MRIIDLIEKKKHGGRLTDEEIDYMVKGYVSGEICDYQMSAMLMAILFKGMDNEETVRLTLDMEHSGDVVDLSPIPGVKVDKHSTGGVGDKTTLICAPVAAACGVKIAKMSGRGLGHTGGTLDKLESVPGFRINLSQKEFFDNVKRIGISVIGQTGNVVPADKKLYALRDVTGTVDSIPLIASSVMSKKLASGSDAILLDVKVGSGAFMKTPEDAMKLAKAMVSIGQLAGRRVTALITDMDKPLGRNIGNALEVKEAIEVLKGGGPEDLTEVSLALAAEMVRLADGSACEDASARVKEAIASGAAAEKLRELFKAQGGDPEVVDRPGLLPEARHSCEVKAPADGYITHMDAEGIGTSAMLLGAGREKKEDRIDYGAGITLLKKTGDRVAAGEPVAILYTSWKPRFENAEKTFIEALTIGEQPPQKKPLILGRVESAR